MGHAFTLRGLGSAAKDDVERSLQRSLRVLEECAALHDQLSITSQVGGCITEDQRRQLASDAKDARRRAAIVRKTLKRA